MYASRSNYPISSSTVLIQVSNVNQLYTSDTFDSIKHRSIGFKTKRTLWIQGEICVSFKALLIKFVILAQKICLGIRRKFAARAWPFESIPNRISHVANNCDTVEMLTA
jgi:hypothetical protein